MVTAISVKAGTSVMVPAPVWPSCRQRIRSIRPEFRRWCQAPPAENGQLFGDAIWAKVFTTVVQNPDPVELNQLVLGNAAVPPETETEIEWQLLQTNPVRPDLAEKTDNSDLVGAANEAVTRRYEFYKYTGSYDPESHEALNDTYDPGLVGDFLGNQNVAANFAPVPEPNTFLLGGLGLVAIGFVAQQKKFRRPSDAAVQ